MSSVQNGKMRIEEGNNRLISNDGNTDILLIGQREDGSLGVDLAQEGSDVKTAPDEELIWSSKFQSFKIVKIDEMYVPPVVLDNESNAFSVGTYDHNLGYVPVIFAFKKTTSTDPDYLPLTSSNGIVSFFSPSAGVTQIVSAGIDIVITDMQIRITQSMQAWKSDGNTPTSTFAQDDFYVKFYLMRETAAA